MKSKLLSFFVVAVLLNSGQAWAGELYSGSCYQTSAAPSKGYYLAGQNNIGPSTNYQKYSDVSVTLTDLNCASGTAYAIQPINFAAPTSSALYGALGIVHVCDTCNSGYKLETFSGPFIYGNGTDSIRCQSLTNLTVKRCIKESSGGSGATTGSCNASNCVTDTSWTTHSAGYVKKTVRTCSADKTTCNEQVYYACNYGYWGKNGGNLTAASGCVACPPYMINGTSYETTTDAIGVDNVTGCYVKAQSGVTTFTDSIGTFKFFDYDQTRCYYDLGNCSNYAPVCTTTSGTGYKVVSGTKTNSTADNAGYCWCNANGKSFFVANMGNKSVCNNSCQDACNSAFIGHNATSWQPIVSVADLGC